MTTYREFQDELQRLHRKAESARRIEKAAALEKIRELIAEYQLMPSDLGLGKTSATAPLPARYRDPVSGATWSGRGRPPRWLEGQDRTRFGVP